MPVFAIRPARPEDAAVILGLLTELAFFEKLPISLTEADIVRDFFGPDRAIACDIGFADEAPVALVTYYWCYATFRAARRLFVEDLFVQPAMRGRGYGKALLAHLAAKVIAMGGARLEWEVLNWNERAIALYQRLGANTHDGWTGYRLEGAALAALAGL
jgi:GNAT superfamily N-acetyltransferase